MIDLQSAIRDHEKRLGLVNFEARESLGGWQAIAKYRHNITGPWGVGCDPDMVTAMQKALIAGEAEMARGRDQGVTEFTDKLLPKNDYEDLF